LILHLFTVTDKKYITTNDSFVSRGNEGRKLLPLAEIEHFSSNSLDSLPLLFDGL